MTKPILLDASCVLAWLLVEPGAEKVDAVLTTSYITSVNMAEVIRKVDRLSNAGHACASDLVEAGLTVLPIGWMHLSQLPTVHAKSHGRSAQLSLGDACCLAYGLAQDMDIWTADQAWAELDVDATITMIRS